MCGHWALRCLRTNGFFQAAPPSAQHRTNKWLLSSSTTICPTPRILHSTIKTEKQHCRAERAYIEHRLKFLSSLLGFLFDDFNSLPKKKNSMIFFIVFWGAPRMLVARCALFSRFPILSNFLWPMLQWRANTQESMYRQLGRGYVTLKKNQSRTRFDNIPYSFLVKHPF